MQNITVRLGDEERALFDRLAEARGVSRSEAIRTAALKGAREELLQISLQRYRGGEVGMRGAAAIVDVPIFEMMHEANERGVLTNYDEVDLAEDVAALGWN